MVKRQKEKQYQSAREHKTISQLRSGVKSAGQERRLPFHCCALSLTPYEHPVCTADGIVFENTALLPFLLKHKVDPVTGKALTSRDVIRLQMDKDDEGRWQCPVLTKPFSDHTKIVAIRHGNEANVYSWQAYQELNIKAKNYTDLISGERFAPSKDVIVLNDPENDEFNKMRDINNFHHVLNSRSLEMSNTGSTNVHRSVTATRIMEKIAANKKRDATASDDIRNDSDERTQKRLKITSDMVTGVRLTSGKTSGSLTSSSVGISNDNQTREATPEEILNSQLAVMRKLKKKGYATLHTNLGDIGLELHCDMAPCTCTNFLGLATLGKYNGTSFHRLIPKFMVQGGKAPKDEPDESLWGGPFQDEFDDRLKHDSEGILSMANAGQKTNKRQFFITLAPAPHLDRKHSVFGRVIQGMDILREISQIKTDKKDRPIHDIVIKTIAILENPAVEAEEMERARFEKLIRAREEGSEHAKVTALGKKSVSLTSPASGLPVKATSGPVVGKYLSQLKTKAPKPGPQSYDLNDFKASRLPPPPKKTTFGSFSGW
jgi:peptidyl-prolyl cis-trans isomerase-like protein 2